MKQKGLRYFLFLGFLGMTMNAWGVKWGRVEVNADPVGAGKVYVTMDNTYPSDNQWFDNTDYTGSGANEIFQPAYITFYLFAKVNDGYYFQGWFLDNSEKKAETLDYTTTVEASGNKWQPTKYAYTARFAPVTITGVNEGSPYEFVPASLTATDTHTLTFTHVGGDELADFNTPTILSVSGDGIWQIVGSPVLSGNTLTVTFTYLANRTTYVNSAGSRTDKATLTLSSKGGSSYTCELSATFPVVIEQGTAPVLQPTYRQPLQQGQAVFAVIKQPNDEIAMPVVQTTAGEGAWTVVSYAYADGKVTVDYTYDGSKPAYSATAENTALLTLRTADGAAENHCALTARFVPSIADGKADVQTIVLPQTTVTANATFRVAYAAEADFLAPVVQNASGGTWTVNSYTFTAQEAPYGTLEVNYAFDCGGTAGEYTADLLLATTQGESLTIPLRVIAEAASQNDASVTTAEGVTTEYPTWAEALAAANTAPNCTLRLLRDIDLGALTANQTIKQTMTLDLNGKTLAATPTTTYFRLLYLDTDNITLTITDSRSGGVLRATSAMAKAMYAVQVNKGHLILEGGRIEAISTINNNTNYIATGVFCEKPGTSFTMNGGEIVATHLQSTYAYGVIANAGSKATINAGTITATAKTNAYGVWANGSATNPSEVTVNSQATLNAVATAYAISIQSAGVVNINGATVNATTQTVNGVAGAAYAYAVYMTASAKTDPASGYAGVLTMNDAIINATAATTYAYGVYLGASSNQSETTSDDTHSNKASAIATITGGKITAIATGATAQGVRVDGNYNSSTNKKHVTAITGTLIDAVATSSAYGVYLNASVNNAHGAMLQAEAELTDVIVKSTATTGGTAMGVYMVQAQNTIASGAYAGEAYATAAKATIQGGSYTASVKTYYAFAISNVGDQNYVIQVTTDGSAIATKDVPLIVKNATLVAKKQGTDNNQICGLAYMGPVEIDNCTIQSEAETYGGVRAVMLGYGKGTISNSTLIAKAASSAYGIYANASIKNGNECYADIVSTDNTITAETTTANGAYALYLHAAQSTPTSGIFAGKEYATAASALVEGGIYTAKAETGTAYAIYSTTRVITAFSGAMAFPELLINNATLRAETGTSNAYTLYSGGNTTIDGGEFTAIAGTTEARGFHVQAGKLLATNTVLNVTASTGTARGVYLTREINESSAKGYESEAELNNLTLDVNTVSGNTAYGIQVESGISKTYTDATFETYCVNTLKCCTKTADGTLTITNQVIYDKAVQSYHKGEFTDIAKRVVINGGTYTATAKGTSAYAILQGNPAISATGKTIAVSDMACKNATITAVTQTGATAYGIQVGGTATIEGCTINATTALNNARGIYVYGNREGEQVIISNSRITATSAFTGPVAVTNGNDIYGIYAGVSRPNNTKGLRFAADIVSTDNTVIATTEQGNNANAVFVQAEKYAVTDNAYGLAGDHAWAAKLVINDGTYTAKAFGTQKDTEKDGNGATVKNKTGYTAYAIGLSAEQIQGSVSAAPECIVNGGKFWSEVTYTTVADLHAAAVKGNVLINNGYFLNATNVRPYIAEGLAVYDLPTDVKEYAEGYRYWLRPLSSPGVGVCKIGETVYKTLEEALDFVNNPANTGNYTILMIADYELPAGNYILPKNATLLVPDKANRLTAMGTTPVRIEEGGMPPSAYLTLSFAPGVNMTVFGTIEASAEQWGSYPAYSGVYGPYGHICLNENVTVDLESGARLMAWGYVTGKGVVNAKRGSTVYEFFQIGDWKGGGVTLAMKGNEQKVLPVTHYFIQNIETPVVYRPGSVAIGVAAVDMTGGMQKIDEIRILGNLSSGSLFLMDEADMSEDTYVKKEYDPLTDRTSWILNNSAKLGSIVLKVSGQTINSADYILPLCASMNVVLQSGILDMQEDTYLMPGAILDINKEATFRIPTGKAFYVIDKDQWGKGFGNGNTYSWTPAYSPSWQNPSKSPRYDLKGVGDVTTNPLPDAHFFVRGTVRVEGRLYTTNGGANISSTNADAGKIIFVNDAESTTSQNFYQCNLECTGGLFGSWNYYTYPVASAQLCNANGSFTQTAGTAAGQSYNYMDGEWKLMEDQGCMSYVKDGSGDHYYISAGDMVEVEKNQHDNAWHDKATGTRFFINTLAPASQAGCQWWEAEPKDNGEYMANQSKYDNYGYYYYYDDVSSFWLPRYVNVTWLNHDGTTLTAYSNVPYNSSPKFLSEAPQRTNTTTANYVWYGWRDASGTLYAKTDVLPKATADVVYTAHFTEVKKQYTVTFRNPDGTVLSSRLWDAGATPVCEVTPVMQPSATEMFTFAGTWQPALEPVTAPAEYTAVYTATPRSYTVTFLNYNGEVLYQGEYAVGTMPQYRGATPVRETNQYYSYTFSGWDKALETVTADVTYTAQYDATERMFGDWLDLVDATADYLVLNMQGYTSPTAMAGWTLTALGQDYTRAVWESDRTLRINLTGAGLQPDDKLTIVAKGTGGVVESQRQYTIPHIYDTDAVLGTMAADNSSIVFVHSGVLTVDKDATVAAIYISPEAELRISSGATLSVTGELVLRTSPTEAAVLTNQGTLLCDKVYYSRIVAGADQKGKPQQIALPFSVQLTDVLLSTGKPAYFGSHFGLMYFDAYQRASTGSHTGNWKGLDPRTNTVMNACQGYQIISPSQYYYEFLFPVSYTPDAAGKTVALTTQPASVGHWTNRGWNVLTTPFTGNISPAPTAAPEDMLKIHVYDHVSGTYLQQVAEELPPAMPFFYQTLTEGSLYFAADEASFLPAAQSAMRHKASAGQVSTQWLRIYYGQSRGADDETTVYLHPAKFTAGYESNYDVVKLSTSGNRPLVYTSLPCGDLAFAALPDSVAEQGIPLTVYAPAAKKEMYFSMQTGSHLDRLQHLYLIDRQEDITTDLLFRDYVYLSKQGTAAGRFFLQPVFKTTDAVTDTQTNPSSLTGDFTAYAVDGGILVEQLPDNCAVRCYDILGKLIATGIATAGSLTMEVPAQGVYLVYAMDKMKKVVVNQ